VNRMLERYLTCLSLEARMIMVSSSQIGEYRV